MQSPGDCSFSNYQGFDILIAVIW